MTAKKQLAPVLECNRTRTNVAFTTFNVATLHAFVVQASACLRTHKTWMLLPDGLKPALQNNRQPSGFRRLRQYL